ncbi:MAG: transporter associated domain-containing protein [Pseudomonadota bacterium]
MSESSAAEPRRGLLARLGNLLRDEPTDTAELQDMLEGAAERELIDQEALNIIFGALHVAEMHVRDIMIPRKQMISICATDKPEAMLGTIIESQHSRFPVYGDDLDEIKGILHAKDLLPLALQPDLSDFDIKDCIRPATIVPESKRLNVLLQEFRANRNHMAVVVDEYGQVSGAVTIEDVLEQIVGEIEDEHDVDDDGFVKQLDEHTYTVKATTTIEDFNEHFDVSFADGEFDTIGGVVLKAFGHVPERGERVAIDGLEFSVLNADSRRLRLLQVTRGAPASSASGA